MDFYIIFQNIFAPFVKKKIKNNTDNYISGNLKKYKFS